MPKYVINKVPRRADEPLVSEELQSEDILKNVTTNETTRPSRVFMVVVAVILTVTMSLLCIWFMYSVFSNEVPQWQQDNFIIESIPGLRYRPSPPDIHSQGTLISFNNRNYQKWIDVIDNFLEAYRNPNLVSSEESGKMQCDYNSRPRDNLSCYVDPGSWGPCSSEYHYNYNRYTPCVFLRLNKLNNFVPEYYNDTDFLPVEMPEYLKEHIRIRKVKNSAELDTVWVSCEGEHPADVEFRGPLTFFPRPGFPGYFFPFKDNLGPLVAVLFERPTIGVVISIECRLWARNIEYNREKGVGFVHFELLLE